MKSYNKNKHIWIYLAILLVLFLFIVGYSYNPPSEGSHSAKHISDHLEPLPAPPIPEIIAANLTDSKDVSTQQNEAHTNDIQLIVMQRTQWKQQGQFKEHFKNLKVAAENGDIEAKYIIAANLRYCLSAPIDDNALHLKLETVAQYSDAGEAIDNTLEKFEYCTGINEIARRQFYTYLVDAAQHGSVAAQETFANLTPEFYMKSQGFETLNRGEYIKKRDTYKLQKVAFLEQAAQHGSEKALMALSDLYHSQQLTENSLANAYALNRLMMEITNNNDLYNRYAWFEQRQYPQLSADELASAQTMIEKWQSSISKNGTLYPSD